MGRFVRAHAPGERGHIEVNVGLLRAKVLASTELKSGADGRESGLDEPLDAVRPPAIVSGGELATVV